jgi:L-Ala-D/L-Glu epimerase
VVTTLRIVGVSLYAIRLPLRVPFRIAYGEWSFMPSIVCALVTDAGIVGWGESVPDPHVTGETPASTFAMLAQDLAPRMLGLDARDLEAVEAKVFSTVLGAPAAKAALEIALNDALGKAAGLPVCRLYGGRLQPERELYYVTSLDSPEAMAREAERAIRVAGHPGLKLKLGQGGAALEVDRVRAIREAVGDVPIRIDANQGWGSAAEAVATIRRLEAFGPMWVEQPTRRGDIAALAEVRARVGVPIMADESVRDATELLRVIELRAADLVNVKLMKCGGVSRAAALCQIAAAAGLSVQVGSMVESSIGSMAGAQLAAARPEIVSLESSGPLLFGEDVGESVIRSPRFTVPDEPGLGVSVDVTRLERLAQAVERQGEGP